MNKLMTEQERIERLANDIDRYEQIADYFLTSKKGDYSFKFSDNAEFLPEVARLILKNSKPNTPLRKKGLNLIEIARLEAQ